MVLDVSGFLGVSFLVVALLGLLWRFSALPELNWNFITSGTMFLLAGWGVALLGELSAFGIDSGWTAPVMAIASILGGLLILIGALQNAVAFLQQK